MCETRPLLKKEDANVNNDDMEMLRRLKAYQPIAFLVTFFGYFASHFARKSYSTVKQELQKKAGYSPFILGAMDAIFMLTYGAGNVISGQLGDTFNPVTVLAIGLWGSGACLLVMVGAIFANLVYVNVLLANTVILGILFLFGMFQATGTPVGTAVMGNWFCDDDSVKRRGAIYGVWTCHHNFGDIFAGLVTAWILRSGFSYTWALVIPALTNIVFGFITIGLVADPYHIGIVTPEIKINQARFEAKRKEMAERGEILEKKDAGLQPISFRDAFKIPMVAKYAIAFGFFKLTNYCLFFWLPYFLEKHFDPVTSNLIASLYSIGMVPGGIVVGYISDMLGGRRALVNAVFMGLLIVFLAVFAKISATPDVNPVVLQFLITWIGILVGGPNNIIPSAVAADLASHPSVCGSSKSLGTVTGLINGCGSVTSAIGLLPIGPLQSAFGWPAVWIYLIVCTATGMCLLGSKIYDEIFPSSETNAAKVGTNIQG
mmetsp:Transcript_3705/g.6555  ORF Transcript_3705/g.6555 Transcript_3705/m.6555 type:complete len:487 (-) Transcript_3705:400-1860(-)|eukprot:CAMPEP_0168196398 /NCGR_PEP_ID=MMETSP0139_2-20121125/20488_1 /TAXON_ID=44445 /ORGANISM="Pseudo-nitzschia australis, Strain 10249 10 AB" /LENGTH=486 /DNA_ID=CAMNT_0008120557 /DNA_START=332 /DNA_END=1792 /DNA_ORIENTATION=-